VAAGAVATLQYYPTTRVIRCLHGLLGHPADRVREAARGSLDDIRHECLLGVPNRDPRAAGRVRYWLAPVWNLLAFTPDELSPPGSKPYIPPATQKTRPPILSEMLRLLADPDTSPKVLEENLWAAGWDLYPAADRLRLRPVLLNHDDPLVRERAAVPLQEWADADGLLALAGDPDFGVRKSAFYRLGLLPAAPTSPPSRGTTCTGRTCSASTRGRRSAPSWLMRNRPRRSRGSSRSPSTVTGRRTCGSQQFMTSPGSGPQTRSADWVGCCTSRRP
jgi:hypothetical protein